MFHYCSKNLTNASFDRCSTDFAEMPSTLMEYFASDPRVLQSIGRHYKTGEKLPLNTLEKYCATRKIFAGVDLQMQTFYSIMDQVYFEDQFFKDLCYNL